MFHLTVKYAAACKKAICPYLTELPFPFIQQMSKAIIYIEETNSMADVTFPSVPIVVSLLHYDEIDKNKDSLPVAGYPVICVTVCPRDCLLQSF